MHVRSAQTFTTRVLVALAICGACFSYGAAPLAAQGLPENQLVQGPDGALYVVEGGTLHQITPIPATPQQIQTTQRGDPVTTGIVIIPPAGAVTPCGEEAQVRVCVLEVERPFQGSFTPQQGLEFARIRMRIENLREQSMQSRSYILALRVVAPNGSTRDWQSGGNTPNIPEMLDGTDLPPGRSIEGNALIAVPVGVPITSVLWVLEDNPFRAVEAPVP